MSSEKEKRKFKYKLSGFEQLWLELERLEEREELLSEALKEMIDIFNNKSDADGNEVFQELLCELRKVPGKSAGYKMIEFMGIEFYETMKDRVEDEQSI